MTPQHLMFEYLLCSLNRKETVPKWGMSEYSSCMNQPMFFVHSSFTVPVMKETGLILPSCKRILGISNITWLSTQGLNSASDGDMFGTWKDKFHNMLVFPMLSSKYNQGIIARSLVCASDSTRLRKYGSKKIRDFPILNCLNSVS